jgi:hypothetical protein
MKRSLILLRLAAMAVFAATIFCAVNHSLRAADDSTSADSAPANTLTAAEKAAGWKLLFDGKTTDGWEGFKGKGIGRGWKVEDGALVCADPKTAGDILTKDQFGAFELSLDYNISENGNSGVIFHSTEDGPTTWATGPEVQLFDNNQAPGHENQLSGWLYQLYKPAEDSKTGKPMDATKPAGQWNHLRLLITPDNCEVDMNGKKYFNFVLGSRDWNERVAKSKFASMAYFGKAERGHLVLQGDHGSVSFRNIKIRPIQ